MKKIIVVTLTMVFLLTACGNQIYGKYKVKDNGGIIEIKKTISLRFLMKMKRRLEW